jgi:hypothetical protein
MLRQIKFSIVPVIVMTLIASAGLLLRIGFALEHVR